MIYISLFHGIGAVDVAWLPIGWKCAAYAEIEPFPIAVSKHHHPDIPNLGDVTKITDEQIAALGPIDLVVGGSPCQDLSVAGKRAGLAGERSGLFHEQLRIFRAARTLCGARWLLWENVPGAFSTHGGRDFGVVVGSMAGAELAVPRGGWGTCGAAIGANGLVEWRVLDAQYVRVESHPAAVPQRRRRVFALLDSGNWADRPPVLLEPEGLLGHPAPRREAGERVAPTVEARANAGGAGWGTDFMCGGGLAEVAHSLRADGFDASEDGTGRGTPLVPICLSSGQANAEVAHGHAPTLNCLHEAPIVSQPIPFDTTQVTHPENRSRCAPGDPSPQLAARGHAPAIAFKASHFTRGKDGAPDNVAPPLSADADKGDQDTLLAAPVGFDEVADPVAANQARTYTREGTNNFRVSNVAISAMQVRRLTPRECERLQGFPDDYTLIPVGRAKNEPFDGAVAVQDDDGAWHYFKPAADGPRYRALGNSMAVNVMRLIGERIAAVEQAKREELAA